MVVAKNEGRKVGAIELYMDKNEYTINYNEINKLSKLLASAVQDIEY